MTDREAGQRLDKFLARFLPGLSKGDGYRVLRKKTIVLNGRKAEGFEILSAGDELTFWFSEETFAKLREEENAADHASPLDPSRILLETEDVIIINKPPGVLSQRAARGDISLVEMLRSYLLESGQKTKSDFLLYAPGVIQRLDRNTSGLVLAAKTLPAARALSGLLKEGRIEKHYLALAEGELRNRERLTAYVCRDEAAGRTVFTDKDAPGAKRIETEITPLFAGKDGTTLLDVRLLTGRTHQIRAQLAELGHPILGDPKYGSAKGRNAAPRQMLHARKLVFPDSESLPAALAGASVRAPLFEDMEKALRKAGIETGAID